MSKNVPGPPAAFSSRALSDAIITNNKRETNWKNMYEPPGPYRRRKAKKEMRFFRDECHDTDTQRGGKREDEDV